MSINAFVGHSFAKGDIELVRKFLAFFDTVSKTGLDFHWDHAEDAEPKDLSTKVIEKMEGKNLFIGICTPRQRSVDLDKLHTFSLLPAFSWSNSTNFQTKISDWILQEIGFSVGRGMKTMLLLENGVAIPGGIQGNIEYIPFSRDNPEESFNKILQMLNSLAELPITKAPGEAPLASKFVAETDTSSTAQISQDKPISEWTLDDYGFRLMDAMFRKDKFEEEQVNNNFLNSPFAADPYDVARFHAFRLFMKINVGKENRFDELLKLMETNPENYYVIDYVARVYLQYEEHNRAATYFEKSASVAKAKAAKLSELSKASIAYAMSGNKGKAVSLLNECIAIAREEENLSITLLEMLSDLSGELNNLDEYIIFTEALLERAPEDHARRYSLAYKYGEDNQDGGAIFHYKMLSTRNPSGAVWNNLGVAFSSQKLSGLAISAYREAEKINETLAMSNIAHKYIDAGFLDEATEITNRAISIENYDQNVGTAIASIRDTRKSESESLAKLIAAHSKKRHFFIDYSAKYLEENVQSLPEKWVSTRCTLDVSINNGVLQMTGEFDEIKPSSPPWMLTPSISGTSKETPVKNYIKYIGKIRGSSVKFDYWLSKNQLPQTENNKPSGSGIMIIEKSKQKIRVYERGLSDDAAFTEITALS